MSARRALAPDAVFLNGEILTLDARDRRVEALATLHGRIVALGTTREIRALAGARTRRHDLGGATVVPGFNDAHCHVLSFGFTLLQVSLERARRMADIVAAVAARVHATPPGEWVRGHGYDDNKLAERRHPTRADLDPVSPGHPVWLQHTSGHMGVANSAALARAGIGRDTPDPEGGVIDRDARGEPTGVLKETAQALLRGAIPPATLEQSKDALAAAGARFVAEGLTSVQDARAGSLVPGELRAYQEATAEGRLRTRTSLLVDVEALPVRDGRVEFGFGLTSGFGTDRLRLGGVKIFLDGSLIGRTAAMTAPYASDPDTSGFLLKSEAALRAQVEQVTRAGWQVCMHAIGDRAIEVAIAAVEGAMGRRARALRPRVEHCGVLRRDLIPAIRRRGMVVVTQPRFITELGDGFRRALGEERLRYCYPLRSLRGCRVALSSDRPVVDGAPLGGIEAAVTQRTGSGAPYVPREGIAVMDAIRWYTAGGAFAQFREAELGTLEVGRWADLCALARDPRRVAPDEIARIPVVLTVVGGEVVHRA
ncbi:MAG TPA: amidohydrolase [Candidatus Tectomicrobia bacterium]|nr:amidohydrolase [Candidatus Tectomicrobia bacterium]